MRTSKFLSTMAKCEVDDENTIEIGQNLMLPNFTFKILESTTVW